MTAGGPAAPVVLHDLAGVEAELARLWQANAAADAGGGAGVFRASSFNLIAVVPGERDAHAAAGVLAALLADHPGRVLILAVDASAGSAPLEAWVSMHCRPIGGGSQVCGEQVVISAGIGALERLPGAIAGLLLPDCPTVLWWRGGPSPTGSLLDRIMPTLDAVLLDGTRFDPATLARWVARVRATDGVALGDLAWERGARWRGWTADCFEPEEVRASLDTIGSVSVAYGPGGEMVALLYLGWLASRLGWGPGPGLAPGPGGGFEGSLAGPGDGVTVALRPGSEGAGLVSVGLTAAGGRLSCALARQGPQHVALTVSRDGEVVQHRLIRQREPDEVLLVGRWLARPHGDPTYGATLETLAVITGAA